MKGDAGFAMRSFKVGDQFVPHVGVTCCCCGKTHWRKASAKGLGNRIFHNEGWLLGTRRTSDKCPDCRGPKRGAGMTPGEKRKAYLAIDRRDRRRAGEAPVRIEPQQAPVIVNTVMAEKLAPVMEQMKEEKMANAMPFRPKGRRGRLQEGGFNWRSDARRAARTGMMKLGVTEAKSGVHYQVIEEEGGTFGWVPIEVQQKEEGHMADGDSGLIEAMAQQPREPTREDNRRILSKLDESYDEKREMYKGDWSDKRVAETLDVPRAWVADIRERVYGPDRNEAQQAETKELREAIAMAEQAVKTLTDMAINAESLARDLRARAATLMAKH